MLGKRGLDLGLDSRFGSSGAGHANPTITTSESRVPLCGPANPVLPSESSVQELMIVGLLLVLILCFRCDVCMRGFDDNTEDFVQVN